LNAVLYLSSCDQSACVFFQLENPSVFTNVAMWEHCTLNNQIFDVAKFTTLTSLPLLTSSKISIPTV
jgi:hypothetical protein